MFANMPIKTTRFSAEFGDTFSVFISSDPGNIYIFTEA